MEAFAYLIGVTAESAEHGEFSRSTCAMGITCQAEASAKAGHSLEKGNP